MSDQQQTGIGAALGLEELFFSREFGRRSVRGDSSTTATATVAEPVQLEQVFLSEVFGHPETIAPAFPAVDGSAPVVSGRPALVLLNGGREGSVERDATRYRAVAAVSGVAAAALVVAGLASGGGQRPGLGQPTISAQGAPPGQSVPALGHGVQPPLAGPGAGPAPRASATPAAPAAPSAASSGGATVAQFTSLGTPSAPAAGEGVPGTAGGGAASTPPSAPTTAGGGPAPGTPTTSGGGGMLAPALTVIGNEVSSVGSSVSKTTGAVGAALPVSSITGVLGNLATSAVNNLGGGSPPTILASALR